MNGRALSSIFLPNPEINDYLANPTRLIGLSFIFFTFNVKNFGLSVVLLVCMSFQEQFNLIKLGTQDNLRITFTWRNISFIMVSPMLLKQLQFYIQFHFDPYNYFFKKFQKVSFIRNKILFIRNKIRSNKTLRQKKSTIRMDPFSGTDIP